MKWKTAISKIDDGHESIRGYNLEKLASQKSYAAVVYLILRGKLPTEAEEKMVNAMLVMMVDHGPGAASALAARIVNSAGNSLHASVAAGVLSLGGFRHGGALGGAAKFFAEHIGDNDIAATLAEMKKNKIYVPGFGHKVLKVDNRAEALLKIAKKNNLAGKYCDFAEKVREEINKTSSKTLPLNMDGANAAILLDMGFDPKVIEGMFLIARMPGLVAQVFEEMTSGEGLRRTDEGDIEYIGEAEKEL